jgi:hypothetical protein
MYRTFTPARGGFFMSETMYLSQPLALGHTVCSWGMARRSMMFGGAQEGR